MSTQNFCSLVGKVVKELALIDPNDKYLSWSVAISSAVGVERVNNVEQVRMQELGFMVSGATQPTCSYDDRAHKKKLYPANRRFGTAGSTK